MAHGVFLLDSAGLDDFLRSLRGCLHPASSLNADHSNASPYWSPALGQADGDGAAKAAIILEGGSDQCTPDGVAFWAMASLCDSLWAHRISLLRCCCSVLPAPFLSVRVHLVVWQSLWCWHSLSINCLDSVCFLSCQYCCCIALNRLPLPNLFPPSLPSFL